MAGVDEELMTPPSEAVAKAVREAGGTEHGKVMKVLFLDDEGEPVGDYRATQLPEDPFTGYRDGIQEPPFSLEQLVFLAESHPVHSAALEQKVADIVGKGWEWAARKDEDADEEQRDDLEAWLKSLAPDDDDFKEILDAVWDDVETLGWGMFECARDPGGKIQRIYHVPAHTVRAHRNGFKLVQIRDNRRVWFRRWGAVDIQGKPVEVDSKTGSMKTISNLANDLFVIKRRSRRSSWYGIPGYISAIGWITLALAARDDNLFFFQNRREPRWAIVLSNLADDPNIEEDLRRAFTVDLRQPHRNVIIPISGPGTIDFQKMSADVRLDGSFDTLSQRADKAIMIGHRVPGDRLANTDVGSLGGNVADISNRVYKEGVVTPGQGVLGNRINRFIRIEYAKARDIDVAADPTWEPDWLFTLDDLDIDTDREELDLAVIAFHGDLITLREARHRLKLGPLMKPKPQAAAPIDPATGLPQVDEAGAPVDPVPVIDPTTGEPYPDDVDEVESEFNDMLFSQLPGGAAPMLPNAAAGEPGVGSLVHNARQRLGLLPGPAQDPAILLLDADVRSMLAQARATHAELATLADAEKRRQSTKDS